MKNTLLIAVIAASIAFSIMTLQRGQNPIAIVGALATQSPRDADVFMISLTIENSGQADRLVGVSSISAQRAVIMNPSGDIPLIVPERSEAILSGDGAHVMLIKPVTGFKIGAFIPLSLTFERAGVVKTRVQSLGIGEMDHSMSGAFGGIIETPAPSVRILPREHYPSTGFSIDMVTENFEFVQTPSGTAHQAGKGHAHLYLNGLKLGRIYKSSARINALLPGDYELRVSLNSNGHKPYLSNGDPVSHVLNFSVAQ